MNIFIGCSKDCTGSLAFIQMAKKIGKFICEEGYNVVLDNEYSCDFTEKICETIYKYNLKGDTIIFSDNSNIRNTKCIHDYSRNKDSRDFLVLSDALVFFPAEMQDISNLSVALAAKINHIHNLPIIIVNPNTYFIQSLKLLEFMYKPKSSYKDKELYFIANSLDEALEYLRNLRVNKFANALEYYYTANKFKTLEMSAWDVLNIPKSSRIESVADHIYGVQHLAIAIFSEFNLNIDIFKVITMINLHKTENLDVLSKCDVFKALIDEFNKKESPEAIFVHYCVKMECDLQAKKYLKDNKCVNEAIPEDILKDEEFQEILKDESKTLLNIILNFDVPKYRDSRIFSNMLEFLKNYNI